MERFIAHVPVSVCTPTPKFKIQYGEIYSCNRLRLYVSWLVFKIQYGEIYRPSTGMVAGATLGFKIQYGEIYS